MVTSVDKPHDGPGAGGDRLVLDVTSTCGWAGISANNSAFLAASFQQKIFRFAASEKNTVPLSLIVRPETLLNPVASCSSLAFLAKTAGTTNSRLHTKPATARPRGRGAPSPITRIADESEAPDHLHSTASVALTTRTPTSRPA